MSCLELLHILCGSNLQSHCVKHEPWLLRVRCWQALRISFKKTQIYMAFILTWLSFCTKYEKSQHFPAILCLRLCFLLMHFLFFIMSSLALHMMRLLLFHQINYHEFYLHLHSWSYKVVYSFLTLKFAIVIIRNAPPLQGKRAVKMNLLFLQPESFWPPPLRHL